MKTKTVDSSKILSIIFINKLTFLEISKQDVFFFYENTISHSKILNVYTYKNKWRFLKSKL